MTIPFSGPGIYVTVGGYLIELNEYAIGTKETSPGLFKGKTVDEHNALTGWSWTSDGTINMDGPWSAKLRLSQKLHFLSIPVPPQGYRYKDGYPKLVKVPAGQECMTPQGALAQFSFDSDGEYIPVEKIAIVNGAGFYLTKAGYVVELNRFRSYEGSPVPGVNKLGITGGPWQWEVDGSINNMKPEWADKLQIVSRAEFSELPIIPLGYKWVDGYPQYRKPKKDEWFFLAGFTHPVKATADKDTHHFIVEKEEPVWHTVNNPDYIFVEGDQYYSVAYGKWMDIKSALGKTVRTAQFAANCRSINKEACLSNVVKDIAVNHVELPDINFNLEKVTDFTVTLIKPSLLKRSFNYWVIEPAANAFRYVVITAVLWGGVEVYKNPAVVWKILPKISVTMD